MKWNIIFFIVLCCGFGYLLWDVKEQHDYQVKLNVDLSTQNVSLQKQVKLLTENLEKSQENVKILTKENSKLLKDFSEHFKSVSDRSKIVTKLAILNQKLTALNNMFTKHLGDKGMKQEEFDKLFGKQLKEIKTLYTEFEKERK